MPRKTAVTARPLFTIVDVSATAILEAARAIPYVDGLGYFFHVTTTKPIPREDVKGIQDAMRKAFCEHCVATLEGDDVLGLDFHEEIYSEGRFASKHWIDLNSIIAGIEQKFGIDAFCVELQFNLKAARLAQEQVKELVRA